MPKCEYCGRDFASGASSPLWDGTANHSYGTGHTKVIEQVEV